LKPRGLTVVTALVIGENAAPVITERLISGTDLCDLAIQEQGHFSIIQEDITDPTDGFIECLMNKSKKCRSRACTFFMAFYMNINEK
jgi:hypothetical protein